MTRDRSAEQTQKSVYGALKGTQAQRDHSSVRIQESYRSHDSTVPQPCAFSTETNFLGV
jgi:hypothetical protein